MTLSLASLKEGFAHTPRTLKLVWKSSRASTLAMALLTLISAGAPLLVAYAGKRIVDAVVAHDHDATVRWVLLELALVSAQALLGRGLALVRALLGSRLSIDINVMILEKALT